MIFLDCGLPTNLFDIFDRLKMFWDGQKCQTGWKWRYLKNIDGPQVTVQPHRQEMVRRYHKWRIRACVQRFDRWSVQVGKVLFWGFLFKNMPATSILGHFPGATRSMI